MKTILSGLLALFVFNQSVAAGENRRFEEERQNLYQAITNQLIDEKACSSLADCQAKKLVFVSPARDGVSIQLWGGASTNTVRSVFTLAVDIFLSGDLDIEVEVYRESKQASLDRPIWSSAQPSKILKLTRAR